MSRVSTLLYLQAIDQELDEKTKRLHEIETRLASDPALAAAHAELQASDRQLADLRGRLRDRELEAKTADTRIKDMDRRLYGGQVSNPKELEGLEKELKMLKRQRNALDDQLLELMDTVDQAQAQANLRANAVKQSEGARADDLQQLTHEQETLNAQLAALSSNRDQIRASMDADALRTYDNLRRRLGRAVAQIRRDSCGVCGVSVPTGLVQRARTGSEIVYCSGCGRILAG